ncbi:energy transducer TonB [Asaia astilbis]|uniref:energy transducer TonB n=1 Tax=Asaia astilbis TaxID=610244 RepID=UPI00046F6EDB|nr:energy transducer TonB [Asaia astilbis]
MNYAEQERRPTKYIVGIVIAVLFHIVVIYALMNGLGSKIVEQFHPPIKTKIITEPKKPPPPPPPPPPPQMTTPPPPYIPPPKIQIQPPPQKHVIKQVTHEKPPAPMPPATVSAPPTPSAPVGPPVPDHSAGASPINGARPVFPEEMLEENREGSVTVACDIGTDGRTSNCEVSNSTGGHAFVEAAMEFLRKARYQPAVTNGQAVVEHHHTLHINFALGDD